MKNRWLRWTKNDLRTEQRQLVDEGCNTHSVRAEFDRLLSSDVSEDAAFQDAVDALLDKTISLPTRSDYPHVEPSNLEGIRAQRPDGPRELTNEIPDSSRKDHISGAWLGRCAGCLLGKPIEGVRTPKLWPLLSPLAISSIGVYPCFM